MNKEVGVNIHTDYTKTDHSQGSPYTTGNPTQPSKITYKGEAYEKGQTQGYGYLNLVATHVQQTH